MNNMCPIMSQGGISVGCHTSCEFYDKENKQCIILTMGKSLEKLATKRFDVRLPD